RVARRLLGVEPVGAARGYGGTWRSAMVAQADVAWLDQAAGYEPFVRWAREWTSSPRSEEILPNICESYTELDGGATFEFKLREGLKWSDGEPVTVEDYRFNFEDCNADPDYHPYGIYNMWTNPSDDSPATCEQVDAGTVLYVFDGTKPG